MGGENVCNLCRLEDDACICPFEPVKGTSMIDTTDTDTAAKIAVRQIECHTSKVERRVEVTSNSSGWGSKGPPQVAAVESCIVAENPQSAFPVQPLLVGHSNPWTRQEWESFKSYADQAWEEYDKRFGRHVHE